VTDAGRGTPTASTTALPRELIGSWSGDDGQGVGGWTILFAPDGSFRESNARRGIRVDGEAAVMGRRLILQPDGMESRTLTWAVSGGRLSLDGSVYLRIG
jgi:hypothetical protein